MDACLLALRLGDAIKTIYNETQTAGRMRYDVQHIRWLSEAGAAALQAGVTTTRAEDEAQVAAARADVEDMAKEVRLIQARAARQIAQAMADHQEVVAAAARPLAKGSFLAVCTGTTKTTDAVDAANVALALAKSVADADLRGAEAAMQEAIDAQVQAAKMMAARAEARDAMAIDAREAALAAQTAAERYAARDADRAHSRMVARQLCKIKRWSARQQALKVRYDKWLARQLKGEEKARKLPTAADLDRPYIIAAIALLREEAEKDKREEAAAKAKRVETGKLGNLKGAPKAAATKAFKARARAEKEPGAAYVQIKRAPDPTFTVCVQPGDDHDTVAAKFKAQCADAPKGSFSLQNAAGRTLPDLWRFAKGVLALTLHQTGCVGGMQAGFNQPFSSDEESDDDEQGDPGTVAASVPPSAAGGGVAMTAAALAGASVAPCPSVAPMTFQYSFGLSGGFGFYAGTATSTVGDLKRGLGLPSSFRVLDHQRASGQAKQLDDEALLAKAEAAGLYVFPPLAGAAPKAAAKRGHWGPSRTNPRRVSTGTPTRDVPGDGSSAPGVEGKRIKRQQVPSGQKGASDTQRPRAGSHAVHDRPLTGAEEAIADEYLVDELQNPDEVINDVANFAPVLRAKIRCLRPGVWLNDEVVNFFMGLLQARADAAAGPLRCHFFSSQWYAKLTEACKFQFANVKRWTKKVDIFAMDLLFIPIHSNGNHWILVVVNFRDKRFEYFDSMGHKDEDTGEYVRGSDEGRLATLRRFIESEHLDKKKASWDQAGWTDHVWLAGVETPVQTNGDDCGVFMCKTAERYARDAHLDFGQGNMGYFRRCMAIEIHNKELFVQGTTGGEEPQPLLLTLAGTIPVEGEPPRECDQASFYCLPDERLKPHVLQILEAWAIDVTQCKFMFDNAQILELEEATPAHPNTGVDEPMESGDWIDLVVAPHEQSGPQRTAERGQPQSGGKASPLTAICVGDLATTHAKLLELSPNYLQPITLLVTHKEQSHLVLRAFDNLGDISAPSAFATQGSMDEGNQGRSCGVEAAFNAGFLGVRAADFNRSNGAGVDAAPFRAREQSQEADAGDDYMGNTGGGNNIPPNQMHATLQSRSDLPLEPDFHPHVQQLNTAAFWSGRMWAVILIPAARGHWVSMERIIYRGQEAFCLREGRGTVTYDFVNFPNDGNPRRLTVFRPASSPALLSPPVRLDLRPQMAAVGAADATPPAASPLAEQADAASGAASRSKGDLPWVSASPVGNLEDADELLVASVIEVTAHADAMRGHANQEFEAGAGQETLVEAFDVGLGDDAPAEPQSSRIGGAQLKAARAARNSFGKADRLRQAAAALEGDMHAFIDPRAIGLHRQRVEQQRDQGGAATRQRGDHTDRRGSSGNLDSERSGSGTDDEDASAFQASCAKENETRRRRRAARVAAAKAFEPGSKGEVAYVIPPTQAEALSIEFVVGVTSFKTMAEVQANVFAVAELHNRKCVVSGRLVEVGAEKDQATDCAEEEGGEEGEGASASGREDDGAVQLELEYVPKHRKVPKGARTRATGASHIGIEYTTLCPHACGGLTQFLFDKGCASYVCRKHRPCTCPPSEGRAVVQRESAHAFTAQSLAPIILEQVCRQKEGIPLP
jgi:hypothetical protein